ncbi:tetratricopeptide repeat protein [Geobacter sp. FeAm09]|uniref:tetratricopeptide repeat protein n=1 Tax=Geobacter sp. FeAm09 TaxID=2597769 RepID=UPI0011EC048B|nr:tetratricopeptide repeat protein [Geobacter sp. FeAm09]QEM69892.1 tetratricopeptide repeat protein [Geobacter sp. FeAm09]
MLSYRYGIGALTRGVMVAKAALPLALAAVCAVAALLPAPAQASIPNRVFRVDIRPKQGYTRIILRLKDNPQFSVVSLPGNRLRLTLQDTDGPLFHKYRRYSDTSIGGLLFSRRGTDLRVTFQAAPGTGWRDATVDGTCAIALDVGKKFTPAPPRLFIAGRERIWNGVEKLVRDFDPPLKTDIPFVPTDRQILKNILSDSDQQAFMAAEAALYKGPLTEAEDAFTQFAGRQSAVRPLALYRLGETWYKLQKYPQALAAFREAEKIWPAFLTFNPSVTFYYGDSIARSGDLAGARVLLARLIARLADKKYAPTLLVRLADILTRQGHDREALAIYRTVADNFPDNKANQMAQLRLADRDFLRTSPWDYQRLSDLYLNISRQSSDVDMREEALFKHVLLHAIHGEASDALQQVVSFQKRFPRGVYVTVCRTIREVLVAQVYHENNWGKDAPGLIRFVEEHQDYLAACMEAPDFLPNVAKAYDEAGRPIELIKFFSTLLDHQWVGANAPYLYEEIASNADLLGDSVLAEKTLRSFLRKYPTHPRARLMLERLGGVYFLGGKYQEARDTLLWLLNKKEHAQRSESYYYLGRSLWEQKGTVQAGKAMDLYIAAAGRDAKDVHLLPDAYYVAASARLAAGDRKGALRILDAGIKLPDNERNDEFLYKAGEITAQEGKKQVARSYFEQVVKKGKDDDWKRLAQQAIESLDLGSAKR